VENSPFVCFCNVKNVIKNTSHLSVTNNVYLIAYIIVFSISTELIDYVFDDKMYDNCDILHTYKWGINNLKPILLRKV